MHSDVFCFKKISFNISSDTLYHISYDVISYDNSKYHLYDNELQISIFYP